MMNLFQKHCKIAAVGFAIMTVMALTGCKSVTSNDTVDYKATGAVRG